MNKKHFNLNKDFNSNIVKNLSKEELKLLSMDIRNLILEKCSQFGGHLASNLGIVELTIALHKHFNLPKDKLIFDVGHQTYPHKILSGRPLDNLRQENGITGFQKRSESIYDSYEAGHSSTSISTATGMAITRDLENENYEVIAIIGDGTISNGLAFEALNHLGSLKTKVIIILNDNDMCIGKTIGGLHKALQNAKNNQVATNIFENLGFDYIGNVDGHNFDSLENALLKAKESNKSVVVHVSTIKGKGYTPSENDKCGFYHGVSAFDISTGVEIKSSNDNTASWSKVYARLLELIMNDNNKSTIIHPATGIGSYLHKVVTAFPNRSFDVGICEEHSITLAGGMALNNYHPYVVIYSTFLQRAYDQVHHDLARLDLPVTLLIDRAGLVGQDGETHQGIFDSSFLLNMPNTSVAMAKNQEEAAMLMKLSKDYNHLFAIRYPKGEIDYQKIDSLDLVKNITFGEWIVEKNNPSKTCLISYGPLLNDVIKKLENENITIINAIFQKPLNLKVLESLKEYQNIVIYDPYSIKEGFSYHVEIALNKLGFKGNIITFALPNTFITTGSIEQQLKRYNLDLDSIISEIKKI
ncbi:MAG: 1-deoxy-D-xylulose-5-phosphate synthase [Bacilli bacterium]|nr:1-deoxy-D-xylulose-5-phosphate synthase [Bacilli bacterium]